MKTKVVGLLLFGLLIFAAKTPVVAEEVMQTTGSGSWCSPAQNGNGNQVICNGVDPRALARLNELLDRKDLDLNEKTSEASEWARKYNEANARLEDAIKQLAAEGKDPTGVQSTQELLHQGNLDEQRLNSCPNNHDTRDCSVCLLRVLGHCTQRGNDPVCEAAKAAQNAAYSVEFAACLASKKS